MPEQAALEFSVLEQAAEWFSVLPDATPPERQAWERWLAAAPEHREAWRRVEAINFQMKALPGAPARIALADGGKRRRAVKALLLLCLGGGAGAMLARRQEGRSYLAALNAQHRTAVGATAALPVPDRTQAWLNTDSAAEVSFDRRTRTVRLVKGQALFDVAHDPRRPFQVLAGHRRVTAVGTSFDVLLLSGTLRVAMLDGVVRVASDQTMPVQTLSRGEIMTVRPDGGVAVRKSDTARLAEWRDGVVYFENTPLEDAAAEMSRYSERPIEVTGRRARSLKVSGAFRTTDADDFAGTMTDLFPVAIDRSVRGTTTLVDAPA